MSNDETLITTSDQNQKEIRELHPCQYCETSCYGYQCKNCHFKMIENRQGNCVDCNKVFNAMRKNGSFRKRCLDCQNIYNTKYIAKCVTCNNDFHAFLDDGRSFEKCLPCYKKTFKNCDNLDCTNNTREEFALCKSCYRTERERRHDIPRYLE